MNHPIFDSFFRIEGPSEPGFFLDWLGVRTRPEYFQPFYKADPPCQYLKPELPAVNEELFEWIDLLTSIKNARGRFTMVELGAGYGRWMVRAAKAIQRRKHGDPLSALFVGLEPEPQHYRWMLEHFLDNGLDPAHHILIQAAVSDSSGFKLLEVGNDRPAESYGQSLVNQTVTETIQVRSRTVDEVIQLAGTVDFLDMDIQGEEFRTLLPAAGILDQRVRLVHIGTHSPDIEDQLRRMFQNLRWQSLNDYGCTMTRDTPYGPVSFQDGVQSWLNEKLAVLDPQAG